jgi:hypothetical protein
LQPAPLAVLAAGGQFFTLPRSNSEASEALIRKFTKDIDAVRALLAP